MNQSLIPIDPLDQFESDHDDDHHIFNCAPVGKVVVSYMGHTQRPEPLRLPSNVREMAVRFNSKRKATQQAPTHGIATGYVDQDTSGTWIPEASQVPRNTKRNNRNLASTRHKGKGTTKTDRDSRVGSVVELGSNTKSPLHGHNFLESTVLEEDSLEAEHSDVSNRKHSMRKTSQKPSSTKISGIAEKSKNKEIIADEIQLKEKAVTRSAKAEKSYTHIHGVFSPASLETEYETDNRPPSRIFVSCNQCREEGLRCNLKRDQPGPCSQCRKFGEACRFVHAISVSNARKQSVLAATPQGNTQRIILDELNKKRFTKRSSKNKNASKLQDEHVKKASKRIDNIHDYSLALNPGPGETLGIKHIYITTCFAHPIRFNYQPDPDNQHPCSWCSSPVFGLWGHSPKEVEVIPFNDVDVGYEEVFGGHGMAGEEASKMCVSCTFQRLSMIACPQHLIKPMIDVNPDSLDMLNLGRSIFALQAGDERGSRLVKNVKWCSICIMPAEFYCRSSDGSPGCGLYLCHMCTDLHERLIKSSISSTSNMRMLDQLIKLWKDDQWKRGDGGELRADVEFLLSTGELFRRMSKGVLISTWENDPLERKYRELRKGGSFAISTLNSKYSRSLASGKNTGMDAQRISSTIPSGSDQHTQIHRRPSVTSSNTPSTLTSSKATCPTEATVLARVIKTSLTSSITPWQPCIGQQDMSPQLNQRELSKDTHPNILPHIATKKHSSHEPVTTSTNSQTDLPQTKESPQTKIMYPSSKHPQENTTSSTSPSQSTLTLPATSATPLPSSPPKSQVKSIFGNGSAKESTHLTRPLPYKRGQTIKAMQQRKSIFGPSRLVLDRKSIFVRHVDVTTRTPHALTILQSQKHRRVGVERRNEEKVDGDEEGEEEDSDLADFIVSDDSDGEGEDVSDDDEGDE